MSGRGGLSRAIRMTAGFLAVWCLATSVWALQRPLKAKMHNYANAQLIVKESKVVLIETFAQPLQGGVQQGVTRGSRIRYANRAGLLPSTYELKGELLCYNKSSQTVEAIALTIVALDAFHQPIPIGGRGDANLIQQIVVQMPERSSKRVTWQQTVSSADVFEVAVIVTRIRFKDGSIWVAPTEELIDVF
jgi:hypothetical protein